jgi:hypothetical protein
MKCFVNSFIITTILYNIKEIKRTKHKKMKFAKNNNAWRKYRIRVQAP